MSVSRTLNRSRFFSLKRISPDEADRIVAAEANDILPAELLRTWVRLWRKKNGVHKGDSGKSA